MAEDAEDDARRIPEPYPATVSEAQQRGLQILITCPACRRVREMSGAWLDRLMTQHGDMTLEALATRGRCTCGHRGRATVRVRIPYGTTMAGKRP